MHEILQRNVAATQAPATFFFQPWRFWRTKNALPALEVSRNSVFSFPPSVPCTCFRRRRPAWECNVWFFQHLQRNIRDFGVDAIIMQAPCTFSHTCVGVSSLFLVRYSVLLMFIFFVRLISTIKSCSSRYYVFLTLGVSGLTIPAPTLVKLKCRTHFHVSTLSLTFITFAQLISRHGTARMGSSLTNKAFGVSGQRALVIVITPI